MRQQDRNAVTWTAVVRRLEDTGLRQLPDERNARGKRIVHTALVFALALGMVAGSRSLRAVEELTASLSRRVRKKTKIRGRISDTKLRDVHRGLRAKSLRKCLHRLVKAEHERGSLKPVRVPFGVVAVDGKGLGSVPSWEHPDIQETHSKTEGRYGLARVHRATLVSSRACVTIDQCPIPGETNEIGALPAFLADLFAAYGRTNLFEVVLGDAGNCSMRVARQIADAGYGYFLRIKMNHGELFAEATRQLEHGRAPEFEKTVRERGAKVTYRLWRTQLEGGWLDWDSARQIFRIERTVDDGSGSPKVGNRYCVTNLHRGKLATAAGWLELVKLYWRCENEQHWTSDVFFDEDARRTPWTQDPEALYVASYLRVIAVNIVAVLRAMCRRGFTSKLLEWRVVLLRVNIALRVDSDWEPAFD
jgi:predicted transposase YbfD/YdcC